jgi:hypothetical protein
VGEMLGGLYFRMKGNVSLGITAEFVSLIKSRDDPNYEIFITPRAKRWFKLFNFFFHGRINSIFSFRIDLQKRLDYLIKKEQVDNLVELGSGFSLRGLLFPNYSKYIEIDFPEVIRMKKDILLQNDLSFGKNHFFLGKDLLKSFNFPRKGKTLFFAEGVVSYFSPKELEQFTLKLNKVMKKSDIFIYNLMWKKHKEFLYRFIRNFFGFLLRSRSYSHFSSEKEAKDYFLSRGFSECSLLRGKTVNFLRVVK